jgi:hypothetical protein
VASAQYGSAENNYYPAGYHGAIFTGTLVQSTDDTITLAYVHGAKTDTFEGYLVAPCGQLQTKAPSNPRPASNIKVGSVLTVYYEAETTKIQGRKEKKNRVLGISFRQIDEKTISEERRGILYCIPSPFQLSLKAFQ